MLDTSNPDKSSAERLRKLRDLINVASGRAPADLLIQNGTWVCVQSGEFVPHTDIAVVGDRIAFIGPTGKLKPGDKTVCVDASGCFFAPGLIDSHMHVESGMLTVSEFVRAVIPHGTTTMVIDPHEIANVFGLPGVRMMVDEARLQPIHVWVEVPSCVPSAPGLETPGAEMGPVEITEALGWEGVIGLGEMMNFPGVIAGEAKYLSEISETQRLNKVISGHYASTDLGLPFHAYLAAGIADDHEGTRREDAVARIRQGMKVMLRYGSAWHDVAEGVRAITELGLDSRHFLLCTDDCHCSTLVREGHVDRALRQAIAHGVSVMTAIQMTTLNAAEHLGLDHEIGQLAPGRWADIILLSDLDNFVIETVFAKGRMVFQSGSLLAEPVKFPIPDWALTSVHLHRQLTALDFSLPVSGAHVNVNVIGIIENQAPTKHLHLRLNTPQKVITADPTLDLAKVAVIERHTGSGVIQTGLVQGFGLRIPCAIASTIAHDCHQMIIVGTDDEDMAFAGDELFRIGGGQVVVSGGQILGCVPLPVAGLMSNQPAEMVAQAAESVLRGFFRCGCTLNNPNMQLSLMALVVIPELRISDKGLVDSQTFRVIPLVEEE